METSGSVAVIDDEASIRRALLRIFRLTAIDAEAYESATAFLDAFAARRPDCIVLDLKMPGIGGIGLLRQLGELEAPPQVIVLTAMDDPKARETCEMLGSRYFLKKPVDQQTLVDCVRRLLAGTAAAAPGT